MDNSKNSTVKFITGFVIGGVVASLISLLYAPMSGRKLRKRITRKTNEVIEDVNDVITSGKDKATELIKESKDKANEIFKETKDKANEIISEGKKKVDGIFHDTKKVVA